MLRVDAGTLVHRHLLLGGTHPFRGHEPGESRDLEAAVAPESNVESSCTHARDRSGPRAATLATVIKAVRVLGPRSIVGHSIEPQHAAQVVDSLLNGMHRRDPQ